MQKPSPHDSTHSPAVAPASVGAAHNVSQEQDPEGLLPPREVPPHVKATQPEPLAKPRVQKKRMTRQRILIILIALLAVAVIVSFAPW